MTEPAEKRSGRAALDEAQFLPRAVIRFAEGVDLPAGPFEGSDLEDAGIGPWSEVAQQYPGIRIRPVFYTLGARRMRRLIKRARKRSPGYVPARFHSYHYVEGPPGTEFAGLAKQFAAWASVDLAYVSTSGPDPMLIAGDPVTKTDPKWCAQKYLDPARTGIDAEYAWRFPGGHGEGQTFADLERGWKRGHEDFGTPLSAPIRGANYRPSKQHGTRVVGVVCAVDNNLGMNSSGDMVPIGGTGIAPDVATVKLFGTMDVVDDPGPNDTDDVEDAIYVAANDLAAGDVLLIESQTGENLPREIEQANFAAIEFAVNQGIVVVAVAGNGETFLDAVKDAEGKSVFNRESPEFRDSGAILVAGASSTEPHIRITKTNYGNRIDCYAWGGNVTTSSTDVDATLNDLYTNSFDGTSSAAAIIAGAAVVVQGLLEAAGQPKLDSFEMRKLLSDRRLGTGAEPPAGTPVDVSDSSAVSPWWPPAYDPSRINVMPDLRKIIDSPIGLGLTASVVMRPFVGSADSSPPWPRLAYSPDMVLVDDPYLNPVDSFAEGGADQDRMITTTVVEDGNYLIYPRLTNLGLLSSPKMHVDVYPAPPAGFLPPALWGEKIGRATIDSVPGGGALTVLEPIEWRNDVINEDGPYTLIAILGTDDDPPPGPDAFADVEAYRAALIEDRRLAICGYTSLTAVHDTPRLGRFPPSKRLRFLIAGDEVGDRQMQLEVSSSLPPGGSVALISDEAWVRMVTASLPYGRSLRGERFLKPLPRGRWMSPAFDIGKGEAIGASLQVHLPERGWLPPAAISVRQWWDGHPVGGMTWKLLPSPHPPPFGP